MASGRSPAPPISICSRAQFSQTCPCFGACEECRSASPARLSYRSSSRLRRRARPRRNAALRERRLTQTKAAPVSRRRSLARNPAGSAGCHDLQPKTGHQVSRSTLAAQSLMNAGGSGHTEGIHLQRHCRLLPRQGHRLALHRARKTHTKRQSRASTATCAIARRRMIRQDFNRRCRKFARLTSLSRPQLDRAYQGLL